MLIKLNPLYTLNSNELDIFHEGIETRLYIGRLSYSQDDKRYVLVYDERYLTLASAIPVGPELPLTKAVHKSKRHAMFPSLLDRIPSRENPAYPEYCRSQGISIDEDNPIILLGTIGRRGPSTIVFEAVYDLSQTIAEELKNFRKMHHLSQNEFALAFGFNKLIISKIENHKTQDSNILRLVHFFMHDAQAASAQLTATGGHIHAKKRTKLVRYFSGLMSGSDLKK